jgi:hypothetical protein
MKNFHYLAESSVLINTVEEQRNNPMVVEAFDYKIPRLRGALFAPDFSVVIYLAVKSILNRNSHVGRSL